VLLVGSAATWALFSSVGRPLVGAVGAFRAIFGASLVAIAFLAPVVPFELAARAAGSQPTAPSVTVETIVAVAYLGVMATAVAWSLWYRGYAAAPPTLIAALFFAQPVVGATLGVVLLHEAVGPAFLVGGALIAVGVLAIASGAPERAVDSPAPAGRTA
jgi:drug/metabolite transporter (DMT)-like permease